MQVNKRNTTHKKLILLIGIFIFGFISLIALNKVFTDLVDKLDIESKNLEAKITIGEFISYDVNKIRALFHELATTTTTQRSRDRVIGKIKNTIKLIENSINILDTGGKLNRTVALNIAGHQNTIKVISYVKTDKETFSLETIDIKPKLKELVYMIDEVNQLLALRTKNIKIKDSKLFMKSSKNLRRYYKSLPSYFTRMSENVSRLLYEGEIELKKLRETIAQDKKQYLLLELYLTLFVISIVLIFGYIIAKIVNKDSKKLFNFNKSLNITLAKQKKHERSIRAILDAQSNIIIVNDGVNMIDSNKQLLTFFDQYSSFDEFKNNHHCVCDFFETNIPNDEYIIEKDYNGISWLNYIITYPEKHFKVIMKKNGLKHHFLIQAIKTILDDETGESVIIITLNDITQEINSQIKLASMNENLGLIVKNKTKQLQELNENLEQKVIIESTKAREKDKQMILQSRFAALGEMIGNIAHQWRQPLSAINTTASGMQLQLQLGLTSNEEIEKSYSNIMGYVDFLTQTIEDFRGFFKEDKEKINFDILEIIKKTLSIANITYKDNDIELAINLENTKSLMSFGMPSELSQVLLNILNNAKDAIVSNNLDNKFVHIEFDSDGIYNTICIQDNAGGIPEDILEKVFDPYFTTKHQSQGTGIGLYMSKDIIENHMDGKLSVKNINVNIDGKQYNGARFKIELPIA
jgi:signal transduction histidine kinase